jgi:hypothetical protein
MKRALDLYGVTLIYKRKIHIFMFNVKALFCELCSWIVTFCIVYILNSGKK